MRNAAGAVLVCAVEGVALSAEERRFFLAASPAGVTLFGRNVPPDQSALADLVRSLQDTRPSAASPLVIAIDQEGGRVARLKAPFPDSGPALQLAGETADAAACAEIRRLAEQVAQRLIALGVNINFAPVCDVLTEPSNTSIGDRAFARDSVAVVARAGAFLAGLEAGGVRACLKHFPGQGAARVDTHIGTAVVDLDRSELEQHLLPFRALLPLASMVMISHCIYPALAPTPASVSSDVITTLLRRECGFAGVVVSDDMNMGALPQQQEAWQESIIAAVVAGADMILVCRHLERYELAYTCLVKEANRSPVFRARLEVAASRVLSLRATLAGLSPR